MIKPVRRYWWLFFPALFAAVLSLGTLFTYWPEMVNYPFFLSRGLAPYRDFSMVYFPLVPFLLLAVYRLVGFTPLVLHVLGTLLLVISTGLVALLVRGSNHRPFLAGLCGFLFAFLAVALEGNHFWFESLLTPLFLTVFYLLEKRKYFWAGALMAVAFLSKQTSAYAFLPIFAFLSKPFRPKAIGAVLLPVFVSFFLLIFALSVFGLFPDFYRWTFVFVSVLPKIHGPNLSPDLVLPSFRQGSAVILLLGAPAVLAILSKKRPAVFAAVWSFCLALFAFPHFAYFHLEPALAFAVLALGLSLSGNRRWPLLFAAGCLLFLPVALTIFRRHLTQDQPYWDQNVRNVSAWLNNHSSSATVFSLHGPDLIYPLTGKPPAVIPWVDQVSWNLAFADGQFTAAFRTRPPDIVVFRPYAFGEYQPASVVSFFFTHYRLVRTFPQAVQIWQLRRY